MLTTVKDPIRMWIANIIYSAKIAGFEKMVAIVVGMITLTQLSTLIGIIIATSTGVVTLYFAIRKHRRKEDMEGDKHLLSVKDQLEASGDIDSTLPLEEKLRLTKEAIKNMNKL